MAPIHNLIHRGIWNDALKRALGNTKSGGGLERFGETLDPTINLWDMPEWAYLRGEHLWAAQRSAPAVAAEFAFTGVSIPENSGLLCTVDGVLFRGGAAANPFLGSGARSVIAATGASGGNAVNRDQRHQPLPTSVLRTVPVETWIGSDPGNTLGGNIEEGINQTILTPFFSPPYVVKPGGAVYVIAQTVNISLQTFYFGRVRQALPGELV